MPYHWTYPRPETHKLTLWPHRSLSTSGFVWFVGLTAALLALPLLGTLGTPILWGLLPFLAAAVGGVWWAIRRNTRDAALNEVLTLTHDEAKLVRTDPKGATKTWCTNPYWVRVKLYETGGPVEKYLTLTGGDREVEIGSFLSPEERVNLRYDLEKELALLR